MGVLRLLLAIAVIITHTGLIYGFGFIAGPVAVQAFYIISGFYMSLILEQKYVGTLKSFYYLFISNRLLRLFPIYWAVLILSVAFNVYQYNVSPNHALNTFAYYARYFSSMNIGTSALLLFSNVFIIFQDAIMFLGINFKTGSMFFTSNFRNTNPPAFAFLFIPQTWTLSLEILFYIIAPFLLKKRFWIISVIMFCCLILRLFLYYCGLKFDPWTYRFFPLELIFFLAGNLSFRIYKKLLQLNISDNLLKVVFAFVLLFICVTPQIKLPGKNAIFLALIFVALPFIFKLSKNWKVDRYIGELSYPVYVCHIFVLMLFTDLKIFPDKNILSITIVIGSIILSVILKHLIGDNVEKFRQKRVALSRLNN